MGGKQTVQRNSKSARLYFDRTISRHRHDWTIGRIVIARTLSKAKSMVWRTVCLNNLKQIGVANWLYAEEDSRSSFSPRIDNDSDVQLVVLVLCE